MEPLRGASAQPTNSAAGPSADKKGDQGGEEGPPFERAWLRGEGPRPKAEPQGHHRDHRALLLVCAHGRYQAAGRPGDDEAAGIRRLDPHARLPSPRAWPRFQLVLKIELLGAMF